MEEGWTVCPLPPTKPSERVLNWAEEFLAGQYEPCEACHGTGETIDSSASYLSVFCTCYKCQGFKQNARDAYLAAERALTEDERLSIGEDLLIIRSFEDSSAFFIND